MSVAVRAERALHVGGRARSTQVVRDYIALTKPRVVVLLEVITVFSMIMAARGLPPLALTLAAGRGYWLVGVFSQTSVYHSATGTRKASWPDGSSIASPRPAVVHQETDTFVTTYTATDPLRLAGGRVVLDGFFGWPVTDIAR